MEAQLMVLRGQRAGEDTWKGRVGWWMLPDRGAGSIWRERMQDMVGGRGGSFHLNISSCFRLLAVIICYSLRSWGLVEGGRLWISQSTVLRVTACVGVGYITVSLWTQKEMAQTGLGNPPSPIFRVQKPTSRCQCG